MKISFTVCLLFGFLASSMAWNFQPADEIILQHVDGDVQLPYSVANRSKIINDILVAAPRPSGRRVQIDPTEVRYETLVLFKTWGDYYVTQKSPENAIFFLQGHLENFQRTLHETQYLEIDLLVKDLKTAFGVPVRMGRGEEPYRLEWNVAKLSKKINIELEKLYNTENVKSVNPIFGWDVPERREILKNFEAWAEIYLQKNKIYDEKEERNVMEDVQFLEEQKKSGRLEKFERVAQILQVFPLKDAIEEVIFEKIKILDRDSGKVLEYTFSLASKKRCGILKDMIAAPDQYEEDGTLEFPIIRSNMADSFSLEEFNNVMLWAKHHTSDEEVNTWDLKFIEANFFMLRGMANAADYMGINDFNQMIGETLNRYVEALPAEEINKRLGFGVDYKPGERERIKKENEFALAEMSKFQRGG